jgi:2-iminobutanoate/2-iminopropanoate deaminase|tara:strand:+ start:248733 stop:249191 length:459 start_codon:yes stop_codon:yes gene_type:complete
MKKIILVLFAVIAASYSQIGWTQNTDTVEYYTASPTSLLSSAVRVGNMLYLSGMMGRDPQTREMAEGAEAETHQIMKNMKATLEKYGSSMDEVVKCTVFMTNPDDRPIINKAYRSYFGENPPARSGVGNLILSGTGTVEIECMATVDLKKVK